MNAEALRMLAFTVFGLYAMAFTQYLFEYDERLRPRPRDMMVIPVQARESPFDWKDSQGKVEKQAKQPWFRFIWPVF